MKWKMEMVARMRVVGIERTKVKVARGNVNEGHNTLMPLSQLFGSVLSTRLSLFNLSVDYANLYRQTKPFRCRRGFSPSCEQEGKKFRFHISSS